MEFFDAKLPIARALMQSVSIRDFVHDSDYQYETIVSASHIVKMKEDGTVQILHRGFKNLYSYVTVK